MHKKFEVNWTKIKGGFQSKIKVSQLNSYSKTPLGIVKTPVNLYKQLAKSKICRLFVFSMNFSLSLEN